MNGEERKRRFMAHWFAIKIPTHFPVASQNLAWDKEIIVASTNFSKCAKGIRTLKLKTQ